MASSYHCMGAAGCQGCFRPSPPPSGSLGGASGGSVSLGIMWAAKARGGVVDKDLVEQVVDVAQRVVASGAISANGHGNVSLRVPGADEMYFTAGPSLRDHAPSAVVRVRR